ncbi:MAG TPA: MSMEG_0565 family glycosyltransferase [Jiangellaceae bacterium]
MTPAPVALVTYSTRPRGGVVHTLSVGEELHRAGISVHVYALGDPKGGFFRPVDVPHTIIPAPGWEPTLEGRVFASIEALTDGLRAELSGVPHVLHTQDCIAARAANLLRDEGRPVTVVRTVHHVDDFSTQALVECQQRSIIEPDHVLVVSRHWRDRLAREFGVSATVVANGVDAMRFESAGDVSPADLRAQSGLDDGFVFLTVGGLEPRKGSLELVEALAVVRGKASPRPRLAVVGGHSFQDHRPYRERCLARAEDLGLVDDGLVLVGTVADAELPAWYHAADAFVFPSVTEGWGLAVLEAMAAGLPVITSDIPVFREYLADEDALLVPPGDAEALAAAMAKLAGDATLRSRLGSRGPQLAGRFTWQSSARQHAEFYAALPVPRSAGQVSASMLKLT